MGLRGPAPKPLELKILEGNRHGHALPKDSPKGLPGHPSCPTAFGAVARRCWRRLVPALEMMRVLSSSDFPIIEALCLAYEVMHEANAELRKPAGALTPETRLGWMRALSSAQSQIRAISRELGLTPSSRSAVKSSSPSDSKVRGWPENPLLKKGIA